MYTLTEIEKKTREFTDKRQILKDRMNDYELGIQAVKRKYFNGIKSAARAAIEKQAELRDMVEESPELFVKPKTVTIHQIRLGFKKEKGKLEWDNDVSVVKLIKKNYSEDWEVYVKVTEKPVKAALENLSGAELKKLGINVSEDTDVVYIKSTDSEIDKLVDALLKEDEAQDIKEV